MIELANLAAIARLAGERIMEIYAGEHGVEEKADQSPLTLADRAGHEAIVAGLQASWPAIPILSEEGKTIPYAERSQWQRFWLVDPLDGTKEFIKRNGEFTVNIALIENGRPVLGVVYVPAQQRLFSGVVGRGAWVTTADGTEQAIRVRARQPEAGLTVVMSRSHPSPELGAFLQRYQVAEAIEVGSSLKLCAVAEGVADLYPRLGPTMEWDTAAGQAVVEAAGGCVLGLDGTPLGYNKENLLNPFFVVASDPGLLAPVA